MAMQKASMSSGTILLPERFREAPTEPREDPLETIDRHSLGLVPGYAEAEDRLFPEWQRAEMTLDSIGDGVISVDKAGSVTYLNPVAERMTGWSRAEASGRTLSDVLRDVIKFRCFPELPIRNPREAGDVLWDGFQGIDEGLVDLCDLVVFVSNERNLDRLTLRV